MKSLLERVCRHRELLYGVLGLLIFLLVLTVITYAGIAIGMIERESAEYLVVNINAVIILFNILVVGGVLYLCSQRGENRLPH